jgi:hypothetical protein
VSWVKVLVYIVIPAIIVLIVLALLKLQES